MVDLASDCRAPALPLPAPLSPRPPTSHTSPHSQVPPTLLAPAFNKYIKALQPLLRQTSWDSVKRQGVPPFNIPGSLLAPAPSPCSFLLWWGTSGPNLPKVLTALVLTLYSYLLCSNWGCDSPSQNSRCSLVAPGDPILGSCVGVVVIAMSDTDILKYKHTTIGRSVKIPLKKW